MFVLSHGNSYFMCPGKSLLRIYKCIPGSRLHRLHIATAMHLTHPDIDSYPTRSYQAVDQGQPHPSTLYPGVCQDPLIAAHTLLSQALVRTLSYNHIRLPFRHAERSSHLHRHTGQPLPLPTSWFTVYDMQDDIRYTACRLQFSAPEA